MTNQHDSSTLTRTSEHGLVPAQLSPVALKRKARNTRALSLLTVPLFIVALISAIGLRPIESSVVFYFSFLYLVVVPILIGLALTRWSIRRAMVFDRQASEGLLGEASHSQMLLDASNKSNLSTSTSSAGISRRVWGTRFKRIMNVALLAVSGVTLGVGGLIFLMFVVVFISTVFSPDPLEAVILQVLAISGSAAAVGVTGCLSALKLEQRLLQTQESLVEIGTHLAGADDQPGSLQLSGSSAEDGQLSLKHQGSDLTQTFSDEHDEE